MDMDEFDRDVQEFNHLYNAVVLFGDEDVTQAAEEVRRLYFDAYQAGAAAYDESGSWADLIDVFGRSFEAHVEDTRQSRVTLLRAMKKDLGI